MNKEDSVEDLRNFGESVKRMVDANGSAVVKIHLTSAPFILGRGQSFTRKYDLGGIEGEISPMNVTLRGNEADRELYDGELEKYCAEDLHYAFDPYTIEFKGSKATITPPKSLEKKAQQD